jgi:hypothetical protein
LLVERARQAERLVPGRQLHGAGARGHVVEYAGAAVLVPYFLLTLVAIYLLALG